MNTTKEMMEHLAGFAKKTFADTGEVLPMWVLVSHFPKMEIMPILAPFSSSEEKDAVVAFVREKAKEMNADLVGFMAEAWTVSVKKDSGINIRGIVPSEHDDRREVINIVAEDKAGNTAAGFYYILRPENGKPVLSPFKDLGNDSLGGRMANILERA